MAKRLFGTILLLCMLVVPATASAHVLKIDGSIGAELHIEPDDNPSANKPVTYTLSFEDETGKFRLPTCTCTASVISKGTPTVTLPLQVRSDTASENHITFTKPGAYTLRITGTPKQPGAFQPFTLNFDVRVTGGSTTMQPMPLLLWVGIGMIAGLLLLGGYILNHEQQPEPNS